MPKLSQATIHVCNPRDYEGRVLIEYGDSVPAWEERGLADLCGPFASVEAAQAVLDANRDYISSLGYAVEV